MESPTSVISSQGQLTVPARVRRHLGVTTGSTLVWEIKEDSLGLPQVVLHAGTVSALKKMRGVSKQLYQSAGGGASILNEERDAWDR
jgi:bifunctional DNA-binding transcriptional regulator/antitoxin component of YhaV-PrlF toxin-antitoxin module